MCGICGVIQVAGDPRPVVPSHVLDRMTDAMTHRGPDDRGTYAVPGASGPDQVPMIPFTAMKPFTTSDSNHRSRRSVALIVNKRVTSETVSSLYSLRSDQPS